MEKEFTVDELKTLMKSVAENKIGELLLECGGYKLKIKGAQAAPVVSQSAPAPVQAAPSVVVTAEAQAQSAPAAAPAEDKGRYITSPIVGTYYSAASPDADPFVQAGQAVREGDTVFIVESMKVMNEVPADKSGIVTEIMVQDGDPVEYGQPILRLE